MVAIIGADNLKDDGSTLGGLDLKCDLATREVRGNEALEGGGGGDGAIEQGVQNQARLGLEDDDGMVGGADGIFEGGEGEGVLRLLALGEVTGEDDRQGRKRQDNPGKGNQSIAH